MFFDIYWFLNGPRDILCHVQSPYKMSHLSPFTCQQNIWIPDVRFSGSTLGPKFGSDWDQPKRTRGRVGANPSPVVIGPSPGPVLAVGFNQELGPKILDWNCRLRDWFVLKFKIIVYWNFSTSFEIFGRIGIFVGDQRASERTHVTRISNRISQNDYYIRTIIFIQKGNNFQRITPKENKYESNPNAFECSHCKQIYWTGSRSKEIWLKSDFYRRII